MPFLNVNGVPFAVADGGAKVEDFEVGGDRRRAYDGTPLVSRQKVKRNFTLDGVPLTAAEAYAWRCYLLGLGHAWSFDASLYSSKGLGPNAGHVASQSGSGGWSGGKLTLNATTGAITFAAGLGSAWTVGLRQFDGSSWGLVIVNSLGQKWRPGGARDDSWPTTYLSVSGGSLTLTNTTGAAVDYDDVFALPFVTPTTWPPLWNTWNAPFSALPRLTLSGNLVPPDVASLSAVGSVDGEDVIQASINGAWEPAARRLSVSLSEV